MLPSAYQEVEYIESSGTQRINTGLNGTKLYRLDVQFNTYTNRQIFGAGPSGTEYIEVTLSNTWSGAGFPTGNTPLSRNKVWLDIGTMGDQVINKWVEDAAPVQGSSTNWQNTITKTMELFRLTNTSTQYYWSAKLYGFQAFTSNQNRNLEADMRPCYRVADGVIGLYDVVRGVFYTNVGTGVFAKGPDIYPEPIVHIDSHDYAIINKEDIIDYRNLFNEELYKNLPNDYEYLTNGYKCKSIQLTPNTTYTISQRAGVTSTILLLLHNKEQVYASGFFDCRKVSDVKTYTTDDSGKLYIGVSGSITQADFDARLLACKIQIELGSTQSEYVPFEWKKGKNLIPRPFYGVDNQHIGEENITKDGITYNVSEDGRITANGITTQGTNYYLDHLTNLNLLEAGTYTVSYVGHIVGASLRVYDPNHTTILAAINDSSSLTRATFTLNETTGVRAYLSMGSAGLSVAVDAHIMLEEGTTASPYEPYNQKALIKSLSADFPLHQDLHGYDHPWGPGMGKNLIKLDESQMSGSFNNYYYKEFISSDGSINKVNLAAYRSYILSLDIESNVEPFQVSLGLGNGNNFGTVIQTVSNLTSGLVTISFYVSTSQIDSSGSVFALRLPRYAVQTSCNYKIHWIQLEEDDGSGDPSPYEEMSNICPITTYSGLDFDVVKTKYKNLVGLYLNRESHNGIKFSLNDNGSFHVEGINTSSSNAYSSGHYTSYAEAPWHLPKGKYTITTRAVGTMAECFSSFLYFNEGSTSRTEKFLRFGQNGGFAYVNISVENNIGAWFVVTIPAGSSVNFDLFYQVKELNESELSETSLIKYPYQDSSILRSGVTWKVHSDGLIEGSGVASANDSFYIATGFNLKPGAYKWSINGNSNCYVRIYDSTNRSILGDLINGTTSVIFITEIERTVSIYIYYPVNTNVNVRVYPLLINYNVSDYEPYAPSIYKHYSDIFSTPIVKGSFEHVSGKLTGLYKKVVFDGSESWQIQLGPNAAMLSNALPGIKANSTPIANYLMHTTSTTEGRKLGYFTFSGTRITLGNMRYITSLMAYQFWADAAAVKAYLAANPLEIAYELETPTSETITTDFIQLYDGKNVLSSDRDLKVTFFDGTEMMGKKFTILLISKYSTMPVHVETDSRFGPNLILPRTKPTHTRDNGWELMFLSKDTELPPGCVCEFDTIGGVIEVPVENSKCELPDSILEDLQANGVTGHVCAIGLNAKYVILDFNLEVVNRFWPYNV